MFLFYSMCVNVWVSRWLDCGWFNINFSKQGIEKAKRRNLSEKEPLYRCDSLPQLAIFIQWQRSTMQSCGSSQRPGQSQHVVQWLLDDHLTINIESCLFGGYFLQRQFYNLPPHPTMGRHFITPFHQNMLGFFSISFIFKSRSCLFLILDKEASKAMTCWTPNCEFLLCSFKTTPWRLLIMMFCRRCWLFFFLLFPFLYFYWLANIRGFLRVVNPHAPSSR